MSNDLGKVLIREVISLAASLVSYGILVSNKGLSGVVLWL